MTEKLIRNENEAIECLRKNKPTSGFYMLQESVDIAIQALEEIQQYRAIGTLEEIRALKEKSEPKKPRWHGHHFCPHCNNIVYVNAGKDIYCPKCGQALDWSE